MYGFRKENKEKKTKQEEYKHEYFRKGCKELLKSITRKKRGDDELDDRLQLQISSKHGHRHRPPSVDGFDESIYIKPEILRDHEDLTKRLHNLMKGYDDLDREKEDIRKTLDRVHKDMEELKGEYCTKLDMLMKFLNNPSATYVKSKGSTQPLNMLMPVTQNHMGLYDSSRLGSINFAKLFKNRQDHIEPTKINYRHMNGSRS